MQNTEPPELPEDRQGWSQSVQAAKECEGLDPVGCRRLVQCVLVDGQMPECIDIGILRRDRQQCRQLWQHDGTGAEHAAVCKVKRLSI